MLHKVMIMGRVNAVVLYWENLDRLAWLSSAPLAITMRFLRYDPFVMLWCFHTEIAIFQCISVDVITKEHCFMQKKLFEFYVELQKLYYVWANCSPNTQVQGCNIA